MNWIKTDTQLPPANEWVIGYAPGNNKDNKFMLVKFDTTTNEFSNQRRWVYAPKEITHWVRIDPPDKT